jgi:hypothetical protein
VVSSFNVVGSYTTGFINAYPTATISAGSNYSAGTGTNQVQSFGFGNPQGGNNQAILFVSSANNLSGTWKAMSNSTAGTPGCSTTPWTGALFLRVA